jgi:hypothetical protein
MSASGREVFDKTVETANAWPNEIMEAIGPDRRRAYRILAAVVHALRDRLTVDGAAPAGPPRRWSEGPSGRPRPSHTCRAFIGESSRSKCSPPSSLR